LVGQQEGHPACKKPLRGCGGRGAVSPVGANEKNTKIALKVKVTSISVQ